MGWIACLCKCSFHLLRFVVVQSPYARLTLEMPNFAISASNSVQFDACALSGSINTANFLLPVSDMLHPAADVPFVSFQLSCRSKESQLHAITIRFGSINEVKKSRRLSFLDVNFYRVPLIDFMSSWVNNTRVAGIVTLKICNLLGGEI